MSDNLDNKWEVQHTVSHHLWDGNWEKENNYLDQLIKRQRYELFHNIEPSFLDSQYYTIRFKTYRNELPPWEFQIKTILDITAVQNRDIRYLTLPESYAILPPVQYVKEELKQWRCAYCGHVQFPESRKCQDCGAPKLC